jgi:hypothetical protein
VKVDTENPDRGRPHHLGREGPHGAVGDRERVVPSAGQQRRYPEIVEIPNRGHALTIDSGWKEVATTALNFVRRLSEPRGCL